MINISTTISFSTINRPSYLFHISLTTKYPFILHLKFCEYSLQIARNPPYPCFMKSLLNLSSSSVQVTIYKKKKRRRRREENMKRRKEEDKKKERNRRKEKKKEKNKKSENKENQGNTISTTSIPFPLLQFHSYHFYINSTTPQHLYHFYQSFSTIIVHIIWENS